ncbi:MAG: excinuclease ABC subunit UvrA [Deltaproteobacteria bacterium]|nr:excinuclease ABC subunit UvrA [Deltaproteobacteria bacterium]
MDTLVIRGARENNLKGIDLDLPRGRLVVITGVSGSGKSSLAFDTIYAEGQRRYVESLSAYARQFLERMSRPDVDTIEGLSPAISIEQRGLSKNPRSTVGTVTEIHDYLRLLFARVGRPHCPQCGQPIAAQSVSQMVDQLLALPAGTRCAILAPVVRDKKGELKKELDRLRQDGFSRVNLDGEVLDLSGEIELDRQQRHTLEVYVDRLAIKPEVRPRLAESLELALKLGGGVAKVTSPDRGPDGEELDLVLSERFACHACGISLAEVSPRLFSFNSPHGACPRCSGLGALLEVDETRLVPDPELSLRQGAIEPWEQRGGAYHHRLLEALALREGIDLDAPYRLLSEEARRLILHGTGGDPLELTLGEGERAQTYRRPFEGVVPNLERRMAERVKRKKEGATVGELEQFDAVVEAFQAYLRRTSCPACGGARLRPEALAVRLEERSIHDLSRLSVEAALRFFEGLVLEGRDQIVGARILREIVSRLTFLRGVGLGYLTLDRVAATLSGGEGQRVRLATQIGAALVGVLYILDEPSIGLHPRDHAQLLETLLRLRDLGNTVLVVEHDEEAMRAADYVVDLGPGAGEQGGRVMAQGTLQEVMATAGSLTGQYLAGKRRIEVPRARRKGQRKPLLVRGARTNNLKGIDVRIPLGTLTCVTGVSGSGKSSLIVDTLLPAARAFLHRSRDAAGEHDGLEGLELLERVIAVDQSPIGRTPRSNPATYAGLFGPIRELFAGTAEARLRGYTGRRFSFNVKGGRCEACKGDGILRIEMHFLPDVYVPCDVCEGRRYGEETLRIRYKGLSIADVLERTVDEARLLFAAVPPVRDRLEVLSRVGLGYLRLGQAATTLSGGEAQRMKLAKELARRGSGHALYILDEPTTGLHFADIHLLLEVLNELVDAGNTVIVIEHQVDVVKSADYVIDLGPEGGDGGGEVVVAGTPEEVAASPRSHTGAWLKRVLS